MRLREPKLPIQNSKGEYGQNQVGRRFMYQTEPLGYVFNVDAHKCEAFSATGFPQVEFQRLVVDDVD